MPEPIPHQPIEDRLVALLNSVEKTRLEIHDENIKRDKRIETNNNSIRNTKIFAFFVSIIALIAVVVAVTSSYDLHQFRSSTQSARVASCIQFNNNQLGQIKAEKSEIRKVVAATQQNPSAQDKKLIDVFLQDYDKTVTKSHPLRDCTKQGIQKYLKTVDTTEPHPSTTKSP